MSNNSPNFENKVLEFVAASSTMGKRAMDKIAEYEGKEKTAASAAPALVEHLIATKVIGAGQKTKAASALSDHAQTMDLLKNAADKIATLRAEIDGRASINLGKGEGTEKAAEQHNPQDSLTSPFVGRLGTEKRASDVAMLSRLGLA